MKEPVKSYVKQHSGNAITPNIDDASLASLLEAQSIWRQKGSNISQSVLIRRAIRLYAHYLKNLSDFSSEQIFLNRAAKGVL